MTKVAYKDVQDKLEVYRDNPLWFIEDFIEKIDDKTTPYKLDKGQKNVIETLHINDKVLFKETNGFKRMNTIAAYIVYKLIFESDIKIGIASDNVTNAKSLLWNMGSMINGLPFDLGAKFFSDKITFGESKVMVCSSPNSIRGHTFNLFVLDNCYEIKQKMFDDYCINVFPAMVKGNIIMTAGDNCGRPHKFNNIWNESPWNGFVKYEK